MKPTKITTPTTYDNLIFAIITVGVQKSVLFQIKFARKGLGARQAK